MSMFDALKKSVQAVFVREAEVEHQDAQRIRVAAHARLEQATQARDGIKAQLAALGVDPERRGWNTAKTGLRDPKKQELATRLEGEYVRAKQEHAAAFDAFQQTGTNHKNATWEAKGGH